jgi:D-inositol-3-phosphate glycosyltransferase
MEKIAFIVSSSGWGGLEMNILNLAGWLKKRDWNIILYAQNNTIIAQKALYLDIPVVHVNHTKYLDFKNAYAFSKLLKKEEIKTLMVFDNRDLDFTFLTKLFFRRNIKVIYQQHMQIGVNKRDLLHTLRYSAIDYWISPLKKLKHEVMERTRFNPEKIKVIPLGVDVEKFYPPRYSRTEAREKLGIATRRPMLGILGRIDPKKGQLFAIKAVQQLIRTGVEVDLLIMGMPTVNDPETQVYFQEMLQYIQQYNLADRIRIMNFTEDVHSFYQAIDIFVLASESETYGMVTIEAMLSGKPVIATNSGGTAEILKNGKLGLLYTHNDANDFCTKVNWIIDNSDASEALIKKGKHVALKKFSHHSECYLLEKLLRKVYVPA